MASDGQTLPPVIAEIQANDDQLDEVIDRAIEKLDELSSVNADPSVSLDNADLNAKIDEAKASLDDIAATDVTATVGADTEEAEVKVADLQGELDLLMAEQVKIRVSIDAAAVEADLAAIEVQIAAIDAEQAAMQEEMAGGTGESGMAAGLSAVADGFSAAADDAGSFSTVILLALPAAGGALALLGGAVAALPAMLTGAAGAVGVLALALEPVVKTIMAFSQAKQQSATSSTTAAETEISNAQSIQTATDQVTTSQQALVQAENSLREAEYQESQAQQALTLARQQAQFQLQDYQNQLADAALAQQGAAQAATQAKLNYDLVLSNPRATELMREQALLAYEQATQGVKDQATQYEQLQVVAGQAAAKGVDGATSVVQAQNAQQQAALGVTTATQNVDNATRSANEAVTNLADAEKQAALQIQSSNSALQTAQSDFGKLTAAGQQFVEFIVGPFESAFQGVSGDLQARLLPGVEQFLQSFLNDLPIFLPFLEQLATDMGQFLESLGGFYSSPKGKSQLKLLFGEAAQFFQAFLQGSAIWIEAWTSMGSQAGPIVTAISTGFVNLANAFAGWVNDGGFQTFLKWLKNNGPLLVTEFGALANVVFLSIEAFALIAPYVGLLVLGFDQLLQWSVWLDESIASGLVPAVSNLTFTFGVWWSETEQSVAGIGNDLKNWADDVWHALDNIWHAADHAGGAVGRFFSSIPGSSIVSGAAHALGDIMDLIPGSHKGAEGLTVSGPSLILAGEGGETEYLIPQSKIMAMIGNSPTQLPSIAPSSASTGGGVTVNVNVNAQGATDPYAVAQATAAAVREVALQTTVRQTGNLYGVGAGRRG